MKKNLKRKYSFLYLYERELKIILTVVISLIGLPFLWFLIKKIYKIFIKLNFSQIIYYAIGIIFIASLALFLLTILIQIFRFISYLINIRYIPLTKDEIESHNIKNDKEYEEFIYKLTNGFEPKKLIKRIKLSTAYEFYLTKEYIYKYFFLEEYKALLQKNRNAQIINEKLYYKFGKWINSSKNPFLNKSNVSDIKKVIKDFSISDKSCMDFDIINDFINEYMNIEEFNHNIKTLEWYKLYKNNTTYLFKSVNYNKLFFKIFNNDNYDFIIENIFIPYLAKGKLPCVEIIDINDESLSLNKKVKTINEKFDNAMDSKYKRLFVTPFEKLTDDEKKAFNSYKKFYELLFHLYEVNN